MGDIGITLEELAIELEKLSGEVPEGFTTKEMGVFVGRSVWWCRGKLQELIAAKKVKCVGRKPTTRIDGALGWIPVFQFIKKEK